MKSLGNKRRITPASSAEAQPDTRTAPVPTTTIFENFAAFGKLPPELQLLISSIKFPIIQSDPAIDENAQSETIAMPIEVGFPNSENVGRN